MINPSEEKIQEPITLNWLFIKNSAQQFYLTGLSASQQPHKALGNETKKQLNNSIPPFSSPNILIAEYPAFTLISYFLISEICMRKTSHKTQQEINASHMRATRQLPELFYYASLWKRSNDLGIQWIIFYTFDKKEG